MKHLIQQTKKSRFVMVMVCLLSIAALAAILIFRSRDERLAVTLNTMKTSNGWGYEIAVDGKTFIRQTTVPAVDGNIAFASKEQAMIVGTHAVSKLVKGQLPQITIAELKAWGVVR